MKHRNPQHGRRDFLRTTLSLSTAFAGLTSFSPITEHIPEIAPGNLYVIGPMEGYSPHIGTIVSMLNYNRETILRITKGLSIADLDFLLDAKANSIGALLMHLGAVDKYYQVNTFEGRSEFNSAESKLWNDGMELGDLGRKNIKGKELKYYIDLITEVRQKTLEEFKKKDDQWLLAIDPSFGEGKEPFNTYWKWFHVCEHESNHRGQMSFLKSRLPGAKDSKE
ncbi:DinB family protein [Flavihumibacter fluvii]|uniref:DinB family protein n=1 Tax=Flavihumibacter fluvii TaxID=2838157 RepID=UPI001BDDF724|nr:DUF664 domain-containing protein [Flavihumibacter fluvii]ULQ54187.1 DinB family protein [Flavihumibacter fluvii]